MIPKPRLVVDKKSKGFAVFLVVAFSYIFAVIATILIGWKFDWNLQGTITLADFALILAVFPALLYFLIAKLRKRGGNQIVYTAFQILAFFSMLPYAISLCSDIWGRSLYSYRYGSAIEMLIPLCAMIPELIAFTAFGLAKRYRIAGLIVMVVSILLTFEILPIRREFTHEGDIMEFDYFEAKEISKESEFRRSIQTIRELAIKSKSYPKQSLKRVVIFNPFDLEKKDERSYLPPFDWRREYNKEEYFVDPKIDSDGDGLPDFREAELLCDEYTFDTDGDGIGDGDDTDPLTPFEETILGQIKSGILGSMKDTASFYLVDQAFNGEKGGFANFGEHIILMNSEDIETWDMIFGFQHKVDPLEDYADSGKIEVEAKPGSFLSFYQYDGYRISLFRRVAVVDLWIRFSSVSGHGYRILLVKWGGEWHNVSYRLQWIAL